MIAKRFFSSSKISSSQLIKYIEKSIINITSVHTDIYQRQSYIERQLHDLYSDIAFIDKKLETLDHAIQRMSIRLNAVEHADKKDLMHDKACIKDCSICRDHNVK